MIFGEYTYNGEKITAVVVALPYNLIQDGRRGGDGRNPGATEETEEATARAHTHTHTQKHTWQGDGVDLFYS